LGYILNPQSRECRVLQPGWLVAADLKEGSKQIAGKPEICGEHAKQQQLNVIINLNETIKRGMRGHAMRSKDES
jgi:hypothetical protein